MSVKTLDDLFYDTLCDIYYAERKILTGLTKMAQGAQSSELEQAFETHKAQTEQHIERLHLVFDMIERPAQSKPCAAIEGILKEGDEILAEYKDSPALDAGLLAAAQAVEHYEISRYGTLRSWADQLGLPEAVEILAQTLEEERDTDAQLTELALQAINVEAEEDPVE